MPGLTERRAPGGCSGTSTGGGSPQGAAGPRLRRRGGGRGREPPGGGGAGPGAAVAVTGGPWGCGGSRSLTASARAPAPAPPSRERGGHGLTPPARRNRGGQGRAPRPVTRSAELRRAAAANPRRASAAMPRYAQLVMGPAGSGKVSGERRGTGAGSPLTAPDGRVCLAEHVLLHHGAALRGAGPRRAGGEPGPGGRAVQLPRHGR